MKNKNNKNIKSIGGYFGLELGRSKSYPHKKALHLQSARNALKLILQNHDIKSLWTPYFTCQSVLETIKESNCDIKFYSIDENFTPLLECKSKDWILYTDYFGINSNNVKNILLKYPNSIIDNAQSFFAKKSKICFYSPRKFIGVSDGGLLYDNKTTLHTTLLQDISINRAKFLLKRLDSGPESGYCNFKESEQSLNLQPPKIMSNLTKKILNSLDYGYIKNKRRKNFNHLNKILPNPMNYNLKDDEIPMVYPYHGTQKMRDFLIQNKIFIATYWINLQNWCKKKSFEIYLQENLLALPIDQRYGKKDMQTIAQYINNYNSLAKYRNINKSQYGDDR